MKKILIPTTVLIVTLFFFWVSGVNIFSRGEIQGLAWFSAILGWTLSYQFMEFFENM